MNMIMMGRGVVLSAARSPSTQQKHKKLLAPGTVTMFLRSLCRALAVGVVVAVAVAGVVVVAVVVAVMMVAVAIGGGKGGGQGGGGAVAVSVSVGCSDDGGSSDGSFGG